MQQLYSKFKGHSYLMATVVICSVLLATVQLKNGLKWPWEQDTDKCSLFIVGSVYFTKKSDMKDNYVKIKDEITLSHVLYSMSFLMVNLPFTVIKTNNQIPYGDIKAETWRLGFMLEEFHREKVNFKTNVNLRGQCQTVKVCRWCQGHQMSVTEMGQ